MTETSLPARDEIAEELTWDAASELARGHVRDEEVEELLSRAAEPLEAAETIHSVLANAELVFAPAVGAHGDRIEVAQGTINALLASPDREVRRTAWENYADAHLA